MNCEKKPDYITLVADHHIGFSVSFDGVVAYEHDINVNGIGFDIACRNKAILLDCDSGGIRDNIYRKIIEVNFIYIRIN